MSEDLNRIIRIMGEDHGLDLSPYDRGFLEKSISERKRATALEKAGAYCRTLARDPVEARALFGSLQITHSSFFRTPLTFAFLAHAILPTLLEEKEVSGRGELRVWSAACAAGQEAYSVAMLIDGLERESGRPIPSRIFATDRAETALAAGRLGEYDGAAVQDVPLKYVKRCLERHGELYCVAPHLRERVDLSVYDLLSEGSVCPPISIFGDFDLVLCRNLLFYYTPEVRKTILGKLRACLADRGYLVTDEAETGIVEREDGFRPVALSCGLFRRT